MGKWVSPTSHNVISGGYVLPANAYDGDVTTATHTLLLPNSIELIYDTIIPCNKVRIYALRDNADPDIDIDVYYGGAYHNIFSGTVTKSTWVEKTFTQQDVSKAKIGFNSFTILGLLYEFAFWDVRTEVRMYAQVKEKARMYVELKGGG